MDRDEIMNEINDFLDTAEYEGGIDFTIDNDYDSITIISLGDD